MELTVITRQRVFGHKPGSVIVVEDNPMVRGLLARNRLDLVDPPELPPLEEASDGKSSVETGTDQELPERPKRSRRKGSGATSGERPAESEGTVPGSIGSDEAESADSADHTEGEAYSESNS